MVPVRDVAITVAVSGKLTKLVNARIKLGQLEFAGDDGGNLFPFIVEEVKRNLAGFVYGISALLKSSRANLQIVSGSVSASA